MILKTSSDRRARVLVADDDPLSASLIQQLLEDDCACEIARDGREAWQIAQRKNFDLLLLDIMMPDGPDGLEVCRTLKDDPETAGITVVMLTSKGQDWDLQAGQDAGADDYFVKPFSPLELIQKVEEVLGE